MSKSTHHVEAGRKGGKATVKKFGKRYMRRLGAWGGFRMHVKYAMTPSGPNDFALVDRETGEVKAYIFNRHQRTNK